MKSHSFLKRCLLVRMGSEKSRLRSSLLLYAGQSARPCPLGLPVLEKFTQEFTIITGKPQVFVSIAFRFIHIAENIRQFYAMMYFQFARHRCVRQMGEQVPEFKATGFPLAPQGRRSQTRLTTHGTPPRSSGPDKVSTFPSNSKWRRSSVPTQLGRRAASTWCTMVSSSGLTE